MPKKGILKGKGPKKKPKKINHQPGGIDPSNFGTRGLGGAIDWIGRNQSIARRNRNKKK